MKQSVVIVVAASRPADAAIKHKILSLASLLVFYPMSVYQALAQEKKR
jgi:hypothetical protein